MREYLPEGRDVHVRGSGVWHPESPDCTLAGRGDLTGTRACAAQRVYPIPGRAAMGTRALQELSDAELDAYILTRLRSVGVDLAVLPQDDPSAPADQRRVLLSARRFLRSTPSAILAWEPDPQRVAPALYPAALAMTVMENRDG